jgi:glycosyltransferase involved in cell wall biosynthesis
MKNRLAVVAAIPNYNMAAPLSELLPQVLEQEYDEVFVLDDQSTDHSRDVAESFGKDVWFIQGPRNEGAAANRNRVIGALGSEALIHFLDADMQLESERTPDIIRDIMDDPNLAFVGGFVKDKAGLQLPWNYGPRQCLHSDMHAPVQAYIGDLAHKDYEKAARLHQRIRKYLAAWPNLFEEPAHRKVFWTTESNMVINSKRLESIGGFNKSLREHEIQDLAIRFENIGLRREFNPLVAAVHKAIVVRPEKRLQAMVKAEYQIAKQHGFANWLLPNGHFNPER